jgi:hypothetical protein
MISEVVIPAPVMIPAPTIVDTFRKDLRFIFFYVS